ncbi:hypothetical protein C8F04DRAFT_1060811 [Mycena alexandri]|uniref:Uncharacterized protein n=1 Tax=Mycena alexandri TaxID=1745969 RepID=A0AAD6TMH6_9AGAR|nr:hypothetical protein C8F04DRAFT_1060811 [Mycena alexandri]
MSVRSDPPEPTYTRAGKKWPVVATAANAELRSLLLSEKSSIAEATVKLQLHTWEKAETSVLAQVKEKGLGSLLGIDFDDIAFQGELGEYPESDVDAIFKAISRVGPDAASLKKDLWTWERLPYVLRCVGLARSSTDTVEDKGSKRPVKKSRVQGRDELVADVDEWIIRNEKILRALSRRADAAPGAWKFGLVSLTHASAVLGPDSTMILDTSGAAIAVKVPRSPIAALPGYTVLDAKRAEDIFIQPSTVAFKKRWDSMTDQLLDGLNWDNVFVAGGIVLGAVLTPEVQGANKPNEWQSSDIDMYIYGLNPTLANKKIEHIAATYQKNLPAGSPFLIVRNSQTITLYSEWPRRRVQIVLKLVKSPREVLLNFDLDVCGCGWDGSEVYLLPRCVRTLETATNTFVMDLINGHYLGDRKSTRDKRVFKYASKGYGLRILPSYISSLATYSSPKQLAAIARGEKLLSTVSLSKLAYEARTWTSGIIEDYIKAGHDNRPFHWPSGAYKPVKSDKPVFSHAMLESYAEITSEPLGRSCLTGFSLLMRHVALWEQDVEGKISIFEDLWASDTYGEGSRVELAYDDSPAYQWDSTFNLADFKQALDDHNRQEADVVSDNFHYLSYRTKPPQIPAARITYADSVEQVLSSENDIRIPLILDLSFMNFANTQIVAALDGAKQAAGLDLNDCTPPLTVIYKEEEEKTLAMWRLNKILNWQMFDREIDEIREVLWAYHRANERLIVEDESRHNFLLTNISKRAIRVTVEDEHEAFVRWVTREPFHNDEDRRVNGVFAVEEQGGYYS